MRPLGLLRQLGGTSLSPRRATHTPSYLSCFPCSSLRGCEELLGSVNYRCLFAIAVGPEQCWLTSLVGCATRPP